MCLVAKFSGWAVQSIQRVEKNSWMLEDISKETFARRFVVPSSVGRIVLIFFQEFFCKRSLKQSKVMPLQKSPGITLCTPHWFLRSATCQMMMTLSPATTPTLKLFLVVLRRNRTVYNGTVISGAHNPQAEIIKSTILLKFRDIKREAPPNTSVEILE